MNGPKLVKLQNTSARTVKLLDFGIEVAPGEYCHVEEGYVMPRLSMAGQRYPSVIEQLAPCAGCSEFPTTEINGEKRHQAHPVLLPVDAGDLARFSATPTSLAPAPKLPTVKDLVAAGVPEGVAEQLVKVALSAATKKTEDAEKPKKAPKREESI